MYDRPNPAEPPTAEPSAKDIEDATARFLTHHGLAEGEHISHVVTIAEVVRYYDDDRPPSYRRVRITDANTHPCIIESLVRHAAKDLGAAMHPTADANSGRFQRHGS